MIPNLVRTGQMVYIMSDVYIEKSSVEETKRELLSKKLHTLVQLYVSRKKIAIGMYKQVEAPQYYHKPIGKRPFCEHLKMITTQGIVIV